jgi:cation diffusion facilitator CzcD-associated flavoprotein CzcO
MNGEPTEVAVMGAGPYGLSVTAHLKGRGVGTRVFGSPMSFWRRMPASINLKSFAFATNVDVPRKRFTFPEYCRAHGLPDVEPCTMKSFADYGVWVQKTILPELEETDVVDVSGPSPDGGGYELRLQTGETLRARSVVVATGLSGFARLPDMLAHLPRELVSHTAEHTTLAPFAGKDVAVVGGGASALEAATLLLEAGARPLLLARDAELVFHEKFDPRRSLREKLRAPNSVLGPGRKSWVLERFPLLLHYLPEAPRVRFTRNYLGPSGPWWLIDRFKDKVPYRLRTTVTRATARDGKVELETLEAGGTARTMTFDHVIAGTGYDVDVDALPFLSQPLRARIRRIERAPALSRNFESSAPRLYFVGPAAALSFGPLFRFVTGASVAAPRVARHVARHARGRSSRP